MRKSKQAYYDKYFEVNCISSKKKLKEIKSLNSLKAVLLCLYS